MTQSQRSTDFTPAQTPQAVELQKAALWVSERIGTGLSPEDAITLRDHLFALAEQVEHLETMLVSTLHAAREISLDAQTGGEA